MADAPIEMWEMQLAFAIGLLGIYVGWRGTIARMTVSMTYLVLQSHCCLESSQGCLRSAIDALVLAEVRNQSQNIISLAR